MPGREEANVDLSFDLSADGRGGVYFTVTASGLFYANPQGVVSQYGEGPARSQRHHPESG